MTMLRPPLAFDPALLKRVREVTKSDRTLNTAIRDGAEVLGIEVRWREADVLAEAIRHHYDVELETYRVLHSTVSLDWFREGEGKYMLHELITEAHEQGYALVEEPVETVHAVPDFLASVQGGGHESLTRSPAWTEEKVEAFLARLPGSCKAVVLTGRFRKLAKATDA